MPVGCCTAIRQAAQAEGGAHWPSSWLASKRQHTAAAGKVPGVRGVCLASFVPLAIKEDTLAATGPAVTGRIEVLPTLLVDHMQVGLIAGARIVECGAIMPASSAKSRSCHA